MNAPCLHNTLSMFLLNEVVSLEAPVGDGPEVLAQVEQLAIALEVAHEHDEGNAEESHEELVVELHLSSELGRVIRASALAEQVFPLEVPQQEVILTRQTVHEEFVLVVGQAHGSLAEGRGGCLRQVSAVHPRGAIELLQGRRAGCGFRTLGRGAEGPGSRFSQHLLLINY